MTNRIAVCIDAKCVFLSEIHVLFSCFFMFSNLYISEGVDYKNNTYFDTLIL